MKKRKVINGNCVQWRSPLLSGAVLFLLLERFGASQWAWAILYTLWGLFLIVWAVDLCQQKRIDIFKVKEKK